MSFDLEESFFSHDISIVIRCPPCSPQYSSLPKTKKKPASKGLKIYVVHFCVDQIVMIDEVQRFSPPLPYLCDKRCSVASREAPLCVCVRSGACEKSVLCVSRICVAFTSSVVNFFFIQWFLLWFSSKDLLLH